MRKNPRAINRMTINKEMIYVILALAWPTMLEQLMQTAVQYIDTAMVGTLGTEATAAVGATATINWLVSIIKEIKNMGFDEVVLTDFRFPDTDMIRFDGDKTEALGTAANQLVAKWADKDFAVSFEVPSYEFPQPEGRSRMYLEKIAATNVSMVAAKVEEFMTDPQLRLVFIAETNDTRFNAYGCLRPISTSTAMGAQKAAAEAAAMLEEKDSNQVGANGRYG